MDMNKAIKIVDGAIDYMIVEADDAWRIIRKELEEAQNKSTNTGSPKFPTEKEVVEGALPAMLPPHLDAKSVAFGAKLVYEYLGRKLRASA